MGIILQMRNTKNKLRVSFKEKQTKKKTKYDKNKRILVHPSGGNGST